MSFRHTSSFGGVCLAGATSPARKPARLEVQNEPVTQKRSSTGVFPPYTHRNFNRKIRERARSKSCAEDSRFIGAYPGYGSRPHRSLRRQSSTDRQDWHSWLAGSLELHKRCGMPFRSALRVYIRLQEQRQVRRSQQDQSLIDPGGRCGCDGRPVDIFCEVGSRTEYTSAPTNAVGSPCPKNCSEQLECGAGLVCQKGVCAEP